MGYWYFLAGGLAFLDKGQVIFSTRAKLAPGQASGHFDTETVVFDSVLKPGDFLIE
jgi:hypothetical protein